MGAFSVLSSAKSVPQKGKKFDGKKETMLVKKYAWSLLQKVLCAHVIKVVDPLNPRYDPKWGEEEDNFNLAVIVSDAQKGIKHFETFMPELNDSINIDGFDINFPAAMQLLKKIKEKYFILDSFDFYGMARGDTPERWFKEQVRLANECKETLKGAKYMAYNSSSKAWLMSSYAPDDLGFDLKWLALPKKQAW